MRVKYRAYDRTGQKFEGTLSVDSPEAAQEILERNDLIVVQVKKTWRLPSIHEQMPTLFGVKTQHIITFSRELATLLKAGIPLASALQAIIEQSSHPLLRKKLGGILESLLEGNMFSDGISRYPEAFPTVYIRLVRIGEETGRLADMLEEVAAYLTSQEETRSKIQRTLAYPAFVMVMSIIALYIIITFSLPSLSGLFREFGASPPLLTRALISIGNFTGNYGTQMILVPLVLGALLWRYLGTRRGKRQKDYLLFKLPIFGELIRKSSTSWFTGTLVILSSAGVNLIDSMELLINNAPFEPVREALQQVREDLLSGESLSQSIKKHPLVFPSLLPQAISVGEEGGNIRGQMEILDKLYEEETSRAISNLIGIIEPALIVTIGLFVGLIGITVINTVYSLLPNIE